MTENEYSQATKIIQKIAKYQKEIDTLQAMKSILAVTPDKEVDLVMDNKRVPVLKQTKTVNDLLADYQAKLVQAQGEFAAL